MLVFDKECFLIIGVGKGKEVLRQKNNLQNFSKIVLSSMPEETQSCLQG